MKTPLIHISKQPITKLKPVLQGGDGMTAFKPRGLWYAINNEWTEWLLANEYAGDADWWGEHFYQVVKEPNAEQFILKINTIQDLDNLVSKYAKESVIGISYIDWQEVAEDYAGIEFNNYYTVKAKAWQRTGMAYVFHSAVDINSGCIWDTSVITLKKLNKRFTERFIIQPLQNHVKEKITKQQHEFINKLIHQL